jgi:hypothetical protein
MIKAPFLDVSTKDGDERIYEDDLPLVIARDLKRLRMTREVLHRCFAEGVRRMQEPGKDWARCRPTAQETLDGEWEVGCGGYNQYTHPLMAGPAKGKA